MIANKTYDGSAAATLTNPGTVTTGVGSETLTLGGTLTATFADANAGVGKLVTASGYTLGDGSGLASNYTLSNPTATTTANIDRKALTVSGLTVAGKTYDGTTAATITHAGSIATGVTGETLTLGGTPTAAFADANAGIGKLVTASGYTLGDGSGLASNYTLTSPNATTTADIAKAALRVVANHEAKFVTQADPAGYAGVSYLGFVNGETANVLGGSLTVSRSNAGTEIAGIYHGVLVPAGLTAANYELSYTAGDFTIVPSNQLLVRVAPTSTIYGTDAGYVVNHAEYWNGSTAVSLSGIHANGGNNVTISDGAGGSATFTVAPQTAVHAGSGKLAAGIYSLASSGAVTENSVNFSDTITVVGSHTVTPKTLALSTSGVAKVYDGTTTMTGLALALAGIEAGDAVQASGVGAFNNAQVSRDSTGNVLADKSYAISGIQLAGTDAGNYRLTGASSLSGNDGRIDPATLSVTYTGQSKVYDGNTSATVSISDNRIGGDVPTLSYNANFADKNVGLNKPISVSNVSLAGTHAGNYTLASASGSTAADITRRASVIWVGPMNGGNWFDPANWADGAVPDLSNVSGVVIPNGYTPIFGPTVVAPAQSGPVHIDSLGVGGGLIQTDGALHIGTGGMTLNSLMQSGGILTIAGNLTIHQNFSQNGAGTLTVHGDTQITDTVGGVSLGNLYALGTLDVTSTGGDITQAGGTAIQVEGATTLAAGGYDITVNNPTNDFRGPFNAYGRNIQVVDGVGGLVFGNVSATGTLDATSTGGDITQAGGTAIQVEGATTLAAGGYDITVNNPGNDFRGPFNAYGRNIQVTDGAGGLVFGNVSATGTLDATSSGGDITQAGGTAIQVNGATTLAAGGYDITVNNPNNDFRGPFNAYGRNIQVVDGAGGLVFGNVSATGTLDATSTGGDITQAGGTAIQVEGATTLVAGGYDITVNNPNNDFRGPFNAYGRNIQVVDGVGNLILGNVLATGNFDATSTDGDITQAGNTMIRVDGSTILDAPNGTIELNATGNVFAGGLRQLAGAGSSTVVPPRRRHRRRRQHPLPTAPPIHRRCNPKRQQLRSPLRKTRWEEPRWRQSPRLAVRAQVAAGIQASLAPVPRILAAH
ncbi:MAG TPA: YDG domain-containing protein [Accumulibacter sp.]|nr:YDG domain-containing protein [Accumulibacter sp.]HNM74561.1 YDG domain-containing protein [Accumulibacter sp.]HNO56711.1 YDG domain-containing protein [Accumulibacter sp.]